ncbi:Ribosome-binding protein 1 [Caenorhabditis elegans]|uniref:Ribosome-binding protein 1 n=1 Tax=Caenorhabditis elegans TaxID=6239 RepID=Q9GRZ9_CAEEL|nr:Ribosome-binding protein 1 [Caenorhabditis elegans]CAC14400.1 Ribosome-binding protein 1 [Caenorhabditis elegans]|eukprot:NP_507506.1 Transmembrane and Coiled-Coil protein [Caenorhabditis elegans]
MDSSFVDPSTALGILGGVGVFVFAIYYMIFMNRQEDNFDKAYNRDALALLTDNNEKKKQPKNKTKKQQQTGKKAQDAAPAPASAAPAAPNAPTPTAQQQPSPKASAAPIPEKPEIQVQKVESTQASAPIPAPAAPTTQKSSPKERKSVNLKDLDQKKVLNKLSGLPELDEAYIQFLAGAFRDSDAQKNNLSLEVKALNKKMTESAVKIEKLNKEKMAVEQREKHEQAQRQQLLQKVAQNQAHESELARQIQGIEGKLRVKEQELVAAGKAVKNNEEHEKELKLLRSTNSSFSTELKTIRKEHEAQLQKKQEEWKKLHEQLEQEKEKLISEKEHAKQTHLKLAAAVENVEAELEKQGKEWIQLSTHNQTLKQHNLELEAALSVAKARDQDGEAQKWTMEKAQMIENYTRLEALIGELNRDISEFHEYKKQQEVIVNELNHREKAHLDTIEQLREQISIEKSKLAELQVVLDAEKSKIVEIPLNQPLVVEEVIELKKTNANLAAAAPSTSSGASKEDEETEKLKAENAQLHEKNEELRRRNMTILEKTEAEPGLVICERKRVAEEMGKLVKKQFKTFDDQSRYYEWLNESVSGIKKDLDSKASAPAASVVAPTKAQKAPKCTAAAPAASTAAARSTNEGECWKALKAMKDHLELIDQLNDEQERRHQEELDALRAQLA